MDLLEDSSTCLSQESIFTIPSCSCSATYQNGKTALLVGVGIHYTLIHNVHIV
jgi:hypothetical protein